MPSFPLHWLGEALERDASWPPWKEAVEVLGADMCPRPETPCGNLAPGRLSSTCLTSTPSHALFPVARTQSAPSARSRCCCCCC
ncbi:TPA: hypothetical protein BOS_19922 [Bos taurus]|nr:TPA: hypothetical protein BOS_19922 [Bos taurus]